MDYCKNARIQPSILFYERTVLGGLMNRKSHGIVSENQRFSYAVYLGILIKLFIYDTFFFKKKNSYNAYV